MLSLYVSDHLNGLDHALANISDISIASLIADESVESTVVTVRAC